VISLIGSGLTKRYGDREVVRSVDLEVRAAQVVGLLGPNGAGKTTTFNMMAGGVRPSGGKVLLGDSEITDLPMYRRARLGITYLPQEPSIFRKLSVADNINAILETIEPSRTMRRERLRELLTELGLTEKANLRGDSLSGGERRRVEITRALVLDPKFMLLDEPFAGIDPLSINDIRDLVKDLKTGWARSCRLPTVGVPSHQGGRACRAGSPSLRHWRRRWRSVFISGPAAEAIG
jgi:lipopolysaccharide export system ATP-binding protein